MLAVLDDLCWLKLHHGCEWLWAKSYRRQNEEWDGTERKSAKTLEGHTKDQRLNYYEGWWKFGNCYWDMSQWGKEYLSDRQSHHNKQVHVVITNLCIPAPHGGKCPKQTVTHELYQRVFFADYHEHRARGWVVFLTSATQNGRIKTINGAWKKNNQCVILCKRQMTAMRGDV